jgi:hypothetical protein
MPTIVRRLALGATGSMLCAAVTAPQAQTPSSSTPAAVVEQQYAALNRHDLDAVFALYADSLRYGEMRDSALMAPSSKAALRAFLVPYLAKNPNSHVAQLHAIVLGPFVIAEERVTGAANGKPYVILAVHEVRHGRIVAELETGNLATAPAAAAHQADSIARRSDAAFARGDPTAAAALLADPIWFHVWGEDSLVHMTRAKAISGFHNVLATNPHMRYGVVEYLVVGPFVADHERLTGMADGKPRDAWEVREIRGGRVVAGWEIPWL